MQSSTLESLYCSNLLQAVNELKTRGAIADLDTDVRETCFPCRSSPQFIQPLFRFWVR